MAYTDHLEVYQSFSTQELTEEVTRLKKSRSGYLSQSVGSKAYTQDLRRIDDMLRAAVRVQNERSHASTSHRGTVSFSGY
jgi:hypothetical protein